MKRWFRNRFRWKVGLFMLPLLLPVGGVAVDADFAPAPLVESWDLAPTPAQAIPGLPVHPLFDAERPARDPLDARGDARP